VLAKCTIEMSRPNLVRLSACCVEPNQVRPVKKKEKSKRRNTKFPPLNPIGYNKPKSSLAPETYLLIWVDPGRRQTITRVYLMSAEIVLVFPHPSRSPAPHSRLYTGESEQYLTYSDYLLIDVCMTSE
jgi:hypothetical protein